MKNKGLVIAIVILSLAVAGCIVYIIADPNGVIEARNREKQEIEENNKARNKYINNSLYTGAEPYAAWYGYNSSCDYYGCSAIKVKAPYNSDVIVVVKDRSENVVGHVYLSKSGSYTFEVPDGAYQTFFYYGSGWNPNKDMPGGLKGGFVTGEAFSKSGYEYISNQELTYVLQLTKNGNFQTQGSSRGEMF